MAADVRFELKAELIVPGTFLNNSLGSTLIPTKNTLTLIYLTSLKICEKPLIFGLFYYIFLKQVSLRLRRFPSSDLLCSTSDRVGRSMLLNNEFFLAPFIILSWAMWPGFYWVARAKYLNVWSFWRFHDFGGQQFYLFGVLGVFFLELSHSFGHFW